MASVELYETQLGFLDRVVTEGEHGGTREEAIRSVLLAHVAQRLAGESDHVGGRAKPDVLEAKMPDYGPSRLEVVLEPVTGKAVEVRRGEVFRIEQLVGGTCVDFNAFNLHDHKEFLDCGFTRSFQSFDPRTGEFIWTNAPRGRPMFGILDVADTCELDLVGHRCNRVFQELGWNEPAHPNCQDSLAEAIREYGLTPDDVHDSYNLWMATTIDPKGRRTFNWNPAQKDDVIDLLAMFDVLAASCICGLGDLVGINNYGFEPVKVQVFEGSDETRELADRVESRWGRMEAQDRTEDITIPVHSSRKLERDPDYAPNYRPVPQTTKLDVELGPEEATVVDGLLRTGVYGDDEGEVLRAAFMRWANVNVNLVRRPMMSFAG